jgi:hypothetical protein
MRHQRVCLEPAACLIALTVLFGCTARTSLLGKAEALATPGAGGAASDSGPTASATGGRSLPSLGGSTTSHPGTGGSGSGGAHASGGASGTGVGGAHASGGSSGTAACQTDADCPTCGSCGPEMVCTPYQCRLGTCRLLCDGCTNDADCVIAYDVTQCCPTCPAALPRTLVAAEPCLITHTESVPFGCRPSACSDGCEMPVCALDAQYARCVQSACMASRCPRGYTGDGCRPLTEADLGECRSSSDCIVVPYAHCCGATKRAVNRLYLEEYHQHPEWQSFSGSCVAMGVCRDDSQVTAATCQDAFDGSGRCELVFP